MANGNGVTPSDYTASDWTPQEWKAAWDRGAIGGNTGLPLFAPGSVKVNSRGDVYNPARVGAGGVNTGVRFPRGDEQPPPAATPAAYKPGDPPPPAPANENINDPTPPAAPAQPATPGQFSPTPWGHPQVAGIPRMPGHGGVIGNATPDGTLTPPPTSPNNPYWMNTPRGQPAVTPFQPQIQRFSNEYGLPPALFNALVHAESGYKPNALSSTGAIGLGQLEPGTAREMGVNNPYDPEQNLQGAARYLRMMYERYHSWTKAISAYNRGPGGAEKTGFSVAGYSNYDAGRSLIATAAALDGGLVKAGPLVPPPQNYRPASYTPQGGIPPMTPDRPPSMWGREEPGMFEGPGAIPHQREIGGVLSGLAPFLMVGLALFSRGAALPMLSAFAGYTKARVARQDKEAEEYKNHYRNQLGELKARSSIEQIEAAGIMSQPDGPAKTEALHALALKYQDPQLDALVQQGKDPTALFQARDKAGQDISKLGAAERLQMEEERLELTIQKSDLDRQLHEAKDPLVITDLKNRIKAQQDKIDAKDKAIKAAHDAGFTGGVPDTSGSDEKGDGESGSEPAAPAESPAAPAPSDSDTPGESGAATPPAPAATPASASAAPTQEPPPDTGRDQIVDAQGNPVRPRSDIQPAVYRGGAPTAQPAADTTAQPAADERIPTPGIQSDSPADAFVSDLTTGGSLDDVPKEYRTQALTGAAWRKGKLDQLAKLSPSSGADFNREIARIDPGVAGVVQRIVDVDQGLPGGSGMSSRLQAYTQTLANLAKKQKPTWDASQWKAKQDLRDDFTKGWRSRTIYRINNLGGAAANVLKEVNRIPPSDQNWQAFANEMLAKGTTSNKEYAGLAAAIRTFAMESTGSTQMGQSAVTLTEELIRSAMPLGSTPAAIREALKIDLGNAVRGFDTLKNEWSSNFRDPFSSAGYNPENDQAFQAIENNLDPDTGLFIDQKSGQPTTDVPTILQPGLMPIIQDGKRFDPVTHRYLGPA